MRPLKSLPFIFYFGTLALQLIILRETIKQKSTNKVIKLLLTKLVNENRTNWDKHLHTILFAYKRAFKVSTSHNPFQLVYGLHALMPTEYLLLNNKYRIFNFIFWSKIWTEMQ
jgi:hypothetical protein